MTIKQAFINGVNTIFNVLYEAVKDGVYTHTVDDGFDTPVITTDAIRIIFDNFTKEDVNTLVFSKEIQPTDIKGLIPAEDMLLEMRTGNTVTIDTKVYSIVEFELDPMSVLYTTLLRGV